MTRTLRWFGLWLAASGLGAACAASASDSTDGGHGSADAAFDGSEDDDAGDTDDSGDFDAAPPDDSGPCTTTPPGNACGLDPNCGCGTGTCDLDRTTDAGTVKCVPSGTGILGKVCTTTSDCVAGLTCQFGACRPFCATSDAGAKCAVVGTNVCYDGKGGENDKVCGIQCDLRDPGACGSPDGGVDGSAEGCAYRASTGATDCYPVGTSTTTCTLVTDCAPGYWCIQGGICQKWCRVGQDAIDCAGNGAKTRCVPITPTISIGTQQYGTCG